MGSDKSTQYTEKTRNIDENLDAVQNRLDKLQESFQAVLDREDLFSKIIEFFPYPIEVYSSDGTTVMVNDAVLTEFGVPSKDMIIGKYNIFEDPSIAEYGLLDLIKKVFEGGTACQTDLKVPLQAIRENYNIDNYDIDAMYQDATAFPIKDSNGDVSHVVMILITRRIYRGKESIINAMEYMKNNWQNDFNLNKLAGVANLSPYHFSRLFKNEIGITPYNYYMNIKIDKLKHNLCDANLSIAEAFSACGVDYHGHFADVFKKSVGVTPSKYREIIRDK